MPSRSRCDLCRNWFTSDWTDPDTNTEANRPFPRTNGPMGNLCDDCHDRFHTWYARSIQLSAAIVSGHGISVTVTKRDDKDRATEWTGVCDCRNEFQAPNYEITEDLWREHVYTTTGKYVTPLGNQKINRWQPENNS